MPRYGSRVVQHDSSLVSALRAQERRLRKMSATSARGFIDSSSQHSTLLGTREKSRNGYLAQK